MGRNPMTEISKRIAKHLEQDTLSTDAERLLWAILHPDSSNVDIVTSAFKGHLSSYTQRKIEILEQRLAALKGCAQ